MWLHPSSLKSLHCASNVDYKIYYHKPIITDPTIHNNRPHIVILAYLIDVAIPNSHNLHSTITETYRKYRHLTGEVKNIAIEKDLYTTTSTIYNGYYCTLHGSLKPLNIRPALHILMQKAVIHNTCRRVRKFLAKQWIRSAWSVRLVLFQEPAKLLWTAVG
jgi:hypothetical protein